MVQKTVNFDQRESEKTVKPEFSFTQTSYRNKSAENTLLATKGKFSSFITADKPKMVKNYL